MTGQSTVPVAGSGAARKTVQTVYTKKKGRRCQKNTVGTALSRPHPLRPLLPKPSANLQHQSPRVSHETQSNAHQRTFPSPPISLSNSFPSSDVDFDMDQLRESFPSTETEGVHTHDLDEQAPLTSRKRHRVRELVYLDSSFNLTVLQQTAYEMWMPQRPKFLQRIFVLDALNSTGLMEGCVRCRCALDPSIPYEITRCKDCFLLPKFCVSCLLASHTVLPFHQIEVSYCNDFIISFILIWILRLGTEHTG